MQRHLWRGSKLNRPSNRGVIVHFLIPGQRPQHLTTSMTSLCKQYRTFSTLLQQLHVWQQPAPLCTVKSRDSNACRSVMRRPRLALQIVLKLQQTLHPRNWRTKPHMLTTYITRQRRLGRRIKHTGQCELTPSLAQHAYAVYCLACQGLTINLKIALTTILSLVLCTSSKLKVHVTLSRLDARGRSPFTSLCQ